MSDLCGELPANDANRSEFRSRRAVAVAQVYGPQAGLEAISAMPQRERLESHYLLHAVLGELHWRLNSFKAAAGNFRRALELAQVGPEQTYLARMIERAEGAETVN